MASQMAGGHQAHEQQLAAALRDLIRMIDRSDYRDSQGLAMRDSSTFRGARTLVDQFDVTHQQPGVTRQALEDSSSEESIWHTGP
jgi:hypothetical protein